MSDFDTFPPSCFDRAYGGDSGFPGTADPVSSFVQGIATASPAGNGGFFEEMPDSPEMDFGEQATIVHTYEMDAGTFFFLEPFVQRGQVCQDSFGNFTKILSTQVNWQKGNRVRMRITAEGLSFGIPPDEFQIEPFENNPDLLKHPRYNSANIGSDGVSVPGLTDQQKAVIRFYLQTIGSDSLSNTLHNIFTGGYSPMGGSVKWAVGQQQMAWEIITKYWRGEDTFYLPCLRVTYSYYNFAPIILNPGGYIEDPVATGQIPFNFWSIDGTPDPSPGNDILQYLPTALSYNLYSNGVTYLRQADQQNYQRTWFKLTKTWIGAPTGTGSSVPGETNYIHWDADLYQVPPTPLAALPPAS